MSSSTSSGAETAAGAAVSSVTLGSVRRRLLRGSAWVLGAKIGTIVLGLATNVLLAHMLPPGELGSYFTSYTLVLIGSTLAQLGLNRAVVRLVSAPLAVGQAGQARQAIRRVFLAGTVGALAIGLLLVSGLGGWLARHVYHSGLIEKAMPLIAGWLVITALRGLSVETFRGLQRFAAATIFDAILIDLLLATILGALFAVGARTTFGEVVAISTGITAVVAVIGGVLLARRVRPVKGEGHLVRGEVFTLAWPLLVTGLAIYLLGTGADLWVLAAFRPQREVALYGVASRLMLIVGTPFMILSAVVPPIIAELHAQGKKRELERSMRAVATLAGIPAVVALVVFLVAGGPVMGFLFGSFYRQAAGVLAILSIARLVAVWTGSSGVVLMMTGHQKPMMYITIFCGAVSVAAGILAAPHFGRVGVAVATAFSQVLQNLLQLFFAKKLLGIWTHAELSPRPFVQFFFRKEPAADTGRPSGRGSKHRAGRSG